jgi:succinyl-CoA synthetase beta subunit
MKIHEHQGKELFRRYGIPTPNGRAAFSAQEAIAVAEELGTPITVVKAQIHAGGRGKGGGVKLANSVDQVESIATELLGMKLVTHQTGPEGTIVHRLLIEEGCDIARELYVGMVLDRGSQSVAVMASTEGGMEIEKVAAETPEKILTEYATATEGFKDFQARKIAFGLGLEGKQVNAAVKLFTNLFKLFVEMDCTLVEINPLVLTGEGALLALDSKINFDDNAIFRHKEWADWRDANEEDPKEMEAAEHGLSYIHLDGDIGCMVNGAGLAMATMDTIKHHGGSPANFLDVGGGANEKQVTAAFKIILSDPNVKALLVNIFGGIMRCDTIAKGLVNAAREVGLSVPLVVRLGGTKMAEGRAILNESGLNLISADSLDEGARAVVKLVKGAQA